MYCTPYFHCEYKMDFSLQHMKVDGFTAIFLIGSTKLLGTRRIAQVGLSGVLVQMYYVHFVYVDYQATQYCIKKYILVLPITL